MPFLRLQKLPVRLSPYEVEIRSDSPERQPPCSRSRGFVAVAWLEDIGRRWWRPGAPSRQHLMLCGLVMSSASKVWGCIKSANARRTRLHGLGGVEGFGTQFCP